MRHAAAQDRGMQHAGGRKIADVLPASTQKAQILDARNRTSDGTVGGTSVLHHRLISG
jgi:hypothetical protein